MDRHARFEQLALSHVLGGLDRGDADDFRSHLRTCAPCRARVAELRGISSSLDAAAREERRRAVALVAGFAFWNLHLRTTADTYRAAADDRGAILRDLATGTLVDDPSFAAWSVRLSVLGTRVALVVADGGPLGSDERLVAWLLPLGSTTEEVVVLAVGPRPTAEVAVRFERGAATQLVVTRERGLLSSSGPQGDELFRVPLPSTDPGT